MDGELHARIGVLDAERRAVGPDHAQGIDVLLGEAPGSISTPNSQSCATSKLLWISRPSSASSSGRKKSASRPRDGSGSRASSHRSGRRHRHLALKVVEVLANRAAPACDHRVAAAVPAQRLAEREVEIQRKGARAREVVGGDRVVVRFGRDVRREARRRGIGRVAGTRDRVFPDEREIELGRSRRLIRLEGPWGRAAPGLSVRGTGDADGGRLARLGGSCAGRALGAAVVELDLHLVPKRIGARGEDLPGAFGLRRRARGGSSRPARKVVKIVEEDVAALTAAASTSRGIARSTKRIGRPPAVPWHPELHLPR